MMKKYVLEIDEAKLKELGTTVEEEMNQLADKGITLIEEEEEEEEEDKTVWRLQEEDFLAVMDDLGITNKAVRDDLLDRAYVCFNIDSWYEHISMFIEYNG